MAKIGENISVRRCVVLESSGLLGAYVHGTRIGVLVALDGGSAELAHDLAMHVAASNPRYISVRRGAGRRAGQGARDTEPSRRRRRARAPRSSPRWSRVGCASRSNEITLLGQPFVKDPELTVEKLLSGAGARVLRFERFEVGAGIEKKQEDFVAEVMAQVNAAGSR